MKKEKLNKLILSKKPEDILRMHLQSKICLVGSQLDLILNLKNKVIDLEEYRKKLSLNE